MDILNDAMKWLDTQRRDYLSNDITYKRGASELQIIATRCKTKHRIIDEYKRFVIVFSTDFIITVDDIASFGLPIVGDKILDNGSTFEVISIAGEPHYIYTDQSYTSLRIYTKRVQ